MQLSIDCSPSWSDPARPCSLPARSAATNIGKRPPGWTACSVRGASAASCARRFLLAGREIPLSFGGRKIKQVFKETNADGSPSTLLEQPIGSGKLLWVGLPVEWNDRQAAVAELYAHAIQTASIEPDLRWEEGGSRPGIYGRCLTFAQGRLYLFVSESGQDEIVRIVQPDNGTTYAFKLASERTVMFAADRQGELIAVYRPREVEIEVIK